MPNALELYKANEISIACGISHYNELTLEMCLNSIARMQAKFVGQRVISGKTPMCASFNAALDFACDVGADILFHTAADVIVEPNALVELLKVMDMEDNYLALAKGYDSIHGPEASAGLWTWNMRIVGREFRFRDVFQQDMDVCQRIEDATGKSRVYTPIELTLGYHHPVWTAEELFTKYRYSLPKYSGERQVQRMKNFLETGLALNPTNKVLLAGLRGAEAAERYGALSGSKDNVAMHEEFLELTRDLELDGTEYYVADKRFEAGFSISTQNKGVEQFKAERDTLAVVLGIREEEIKRLTADLEKERQKLKKERNRLHALQSSFSYQLGSLLVQAVRKPGRNTVLLPFQLLRLARLAVHKVRGEKIAVSTVAEQAQKAMARKDWAQAVAGLRAGLPAYSGKAQAKIYAMLGQALRQQGLLDEADEILREGIAKYPKYFDLSVEHAEVAMARKDWQAAYKRLRLRYSTQKARRQVATRLPLLEYGSINGGVAEWEQRWREASPDRRVLMVVPLDFAGSMYKLAEAVNRYTTYALRLVTFEFHQFDYPVDLVVPECDDARLEAVFKLASEAAIFHLKDEHSWFLAGERFPNLRLLDDLFFSNKFPRNLKVFTHYGGHARKFKQDAEYIARVQQFDGRIALTPDLNFDWFNGSYIPHTIDTDTIPKSWSDSNILAHSPSTKNVQRKATDILEKAVAVLEKYHQDVWHNWSVDIIHGVPYDECMKRKGRASLFFDQAGSHAGTGLGIGDVIGWYGNSAIEAMAFGIPTIAHLSEVACERAEKAGFPVRDIPIINIPRTLDGLVEAILSFAMQSPQERKALSERTRQFAVEFHGYEAVGRRMAQVYDELLRRQGARQHG